MQRSNTTNITNRAVRSRSIHHGNKESIKTVLAQHPRAMLILFSCCIAIATGYATPFTLGVSQATNSIDTSKNGTVANGDNSGNAQQGTPRLQKGTPTFRTVLPAGKTIEQLGGWTRVSPPNRDPVYVYVDRIGDVQIQVSEQQLPEKFRSNTVDEMGKLATNFSADKRLNVPGAVVFLGTSAKGPQSVIVAKNNLLILIKSAGIIPTSDWEEYIKSLG